MTISSPDDERTVMPSASTASDGQMSTHDVDNHALPPGIRLNEFEIMSVVGVGGFGIVYKVYDHSLQREIALKEYMPSSLARRSGLSHVTVKSSRYAEPFEAGLRSFINEARLLARFDHPSLLKVYQFWQANDTAYMAMPLYKGLTLAQMLRGREQPPSEEWLKSLLATLLDVLETIHSERCYHRDIAPDNILMLADDHPLLLDFGAARRAIGDTAQAFTVILKPGYAPIEQYADAASMRQGPWTDIYALASVIHFAITGRPPVSSIARIDSDSQVPLTQSASGRYSKEFLRTIDRALSVKPDDRPQTVSELRQMLGLKSLLPMPDSKISDQTQSEVPRTSEFSEPSELTVQIPNNDGKALKKKRLHMIVIGTGTATVIAATSIFLGVREGKRPPAISATPAASTAGSTESPAPFDSRPVPAIEKSPVEKTIGPVEIIDQIFEGRNPNHDVSVSLGMQKVRIGKDQLRFSVRSSKPGHVYLLMVGTDRSQFWLLFPNAIDKNNRINPAKRLELPRPNWRMDAAGPPGTNHFVALVSESPRDFKSAGLRSNGPFAEFTSTTVTVSAQDAVNKGLVFVGKAVCSDRQRNTCSELYGAAKFDIEEVAAR